MKRPWAFHAETITGRKRKKHATELPESVRTFPMIRAGAACGLIDFIARPELTEEIVQRSGIALNVILDRNKELPLSQFMQLLNIAAEVTDNPYLGLHLGLRSELPQLGILGYVMLNAHTILAALNRLEKYYNFHQQGTEIRISSDRENTRLIYGVTASGTPDRRQDAEMSIASFFSFVNALAGTRTTPRAVHFTHPEPEKSTEHHRLFRCPVWFDQPENCLVYSNDTLLKPVADADKELLHVLEDYLERIVAELPSEDDLPGLVAYHISAILRGGTPSAELVAERMGLSSRTLRRHLAEENTSFREIVQGTREKAARDYLEHTTLPITEIAFLLGYSGLSAFNHAFHCWTQKSPREFRKEKRNK